MKVTVTDLGECKRQVDVEVPYAEVEPEIQKGYKKYQKKARIDGFRQGKIPLSILKKQFGQAIEHEVREELIQKYFRLAVVQEEIPIVSPGTVKEVNFQEGRPFSFVSEVEVEPDIDPDDYQGFKVEKRTVKVTDEDVERTLQLLREERASFSEVGEGASGGNLVHGEVQALDSSGVPMIGQKWPARMFELGDNQVGRLLGDQLNGVKKGDTRRFSITQPAEDGSNKTDHYSINVEKVEEKILPELNDTFAQELGQYENLQNLKEEVRRSLEARRDDEAEKGLRQRIMDEIIKRNDFSLPGAMVQNLLDSLWEEESSRGEQRMTRQDFDNSQRPLVVWHLKWNLISERLAEKESISVSEEEVNEEINRIISQNEKEQMKLKAWFKKEENRRRIQNTLAENKLMEFLKNKLKIKEVTVKPEKAKSSLIT